MSILDKILGGRSKRHEEQITQDLRSLGKDYPELKQFVEPLAKSIQTGVDPEGGKTDYREIASLIQGVVIDVATNQGSKDAVPKLQAIARSLDQIAEKKKGSALGLAMKGQQLLDQERFDEAITNLTEALEIDPEDKGDARYNLGVAYMKKALKDELSGSNMLTSREKKDLLDKAEECWRVVLQRNPKHKMASSSLSQLRSFRSQYG